jgi:predicted ArsR family transcriptional regulator
MESTAAADGPGKTRHAIVKLLKTEGAMDATRLGKRLSLTPMAVRQHLYDLQREKLVSAQERPAAVGRPAKYWQLTRDADRLFPSAYAELSVALIDALGEALGETGVKRVLDSRCARQKKEYTARIPASLALKEKVQRLARIRKEEGYMAEMKRQQGGGFLLVENHCPICAAATACKGFCYTELDLFQTVLGPGVTIERTEHILAGNRRCAYRIRKAHSGRVVRTSCRSAANLRG